jgi:hypothetical protein
MQLFNGACCGVRIGNIRRDMISEWYCRENTEIETREEAELIPFMRERWGE